MDDKLYLAMIDKFNSSEISELEFNDGNTKFVLRKESTNNGQNTGVQNDLVTASNEPKGQSVKLGIPSGGGEKITSPIVATFYASPGPDSPPFVKPGSKIKAGQTLCILEAMKMMNNLEAEFDCEVITIHAGSGELVEYGQDLFTVVKT